MPLYRCVACGFVTTASRDNAFEAHTVGSPDCHAPLSMITDFARAAAVAGPNGRRRRTLARPLRGEPLDGPKA